MLADFIEPKEAATLFAELRAEFPFEEREIVLFGRSIKQPRLIAWAGEVPYRYSGQTLEPRPLGPRLEALRHRLQQELPLDERRVFNHILLNLYRNGRDSMGLHRDDEPELGPRPLLASLSLGATRRFRLVPDPSRFSEDALPEPRNLWLTSGSLLIMGGALQSEFRHELPKDSRVSAPRLNLTFRSIIGTPGP